MRPHYVLLLLLTGCGGGAQLLLHDPIESKCEDAKLKACGELTDGVLFYVDGENARGYDKLTSAVVQNTDDPAQLKLLASGLKLLERAPGVGPYVAKLKPAIDVLDAAADKARKEGTGHAKTTPSRVNGVAMTHSTGAVEESSIKTGTVLVVLSPGADACAPLAGLPGAFVGGTSQCAAGPAGPAIVTDLPVPGGCSNDLLLFAGDPAKPRWWLLVPAGAPLALTRAKLAVNRGESLFFSARARDGALKNDAACAITWSATKAG